VHDALAARGAQNVRGALDMDTLHQRRVHRLVRDRARGMDHGVDAIDRRVERARIVDVADHRLDAEIRSDGEPTRAPGDPRAPPGCGGRGSRSRR
jgi:hypothetical protein